MGSCLFWGAKPQPQGSQLHFGVPNPNSGAPGSVLGVPSPNFGAPSSVLGLPNPRVSTPSLLHRMQLSSGGTCGGTGTVMGTPCTPAAPSWLGTSGVRDGAWCHPGVTWGWRGSSASREARGAGNPEKFWVIGKNMSPILERSWKGVQGDGGRQGSLSLSLPVANKWIHEHGQEFRRPCSTDPQD